jgi:drug/metabolite transporter (DMT)-like permease
MLFVVLLGLGAAAFLGVGWVMQQRVAIRSKSSELLSWKLLMELIHSPLWWGGIAAMAVGQSLSAWALQLGAISSVEPILVTCLLFAFVVSAFAADERPRWQELAGPIVLCAALAVFLAVSDPKINHNNDPGWHQIALATVISAAAAAALGLAGKTLGARIALFVESGLIGAAAGVMYGLQDAATRGAIVAVEHGDFVGMLATMWPWVLLAAATAGVLLSQSAFRAERLDYALPPTVAAQPIAGVLLGVGLLGDELLTSPLALAVEFLCLVGMLAGVAVTGRSPAMRQRPSVTSSDG